jgi:hypothetical protein
MEILTTIQDFLNWSVGEKHHGRQLSDYAIDKQSLEEERKTRFNISWEAN